MQRSTNHGFGFVFNSSKLRSGIVFLFLVTMSNSLDISLEFSDVRMSQKNKLSKQHTAVALKSAVSSSESVADDVYKVSGAVWSL